MKAKFLTSFPFRETSWGHLGQGLKCLLFLLILILNFLSIPNEQSPSESLEESLTPQNLVIKNSHPHVPGDDYAILSCQRTQNQKGQDQAVLYLWSLSFNLHEGFPFQVRNSDEVKAPPTQWRHTLLFSRPPPLTYFS